jgi:hypothetical protein
MSCSTFSSLANNTRSSTYFTVYYCSICQRLAVQNTATSQDSRDLSCVKIPYLPDHAITCLFRV